MSKVSLSFILSVADAFDIELLLALRYVCKVFHTRWIEHVRQILREKDTGCIVSVEDNLDLDTLFINVQIIDIKQVMCSRIYHITRNKSRDITRITVESNESDIQTVFFGTKKVRITSNTIIALIKRGDDVRGFIYYCIDSLFQ